MPTSKPAISRRRGGYQPPGPHRRVPGGLDDGSAGCPHPAKPHRRDQQARNQRRPAADPLVGAAFMAARAAPPELAGFRSRHPGHGGMWACRPTVLGGSAAEIPSHLGRLSAAPTPATWRRAGCPTGHAGWYRPAIHAPRPSSASRGGEWPPGRTAGIGGLSVQAPRPWGWGMPPSWADAAKPPGGAVRRAFPPQGGVTPRRIAGPTGPQFTHPGPSPRRGGLYGRPCRTAGIGGLSVRMPGHGGMWACRPTVLGGSTAEIPSHLGRLSAARTAPPDPPGLRVVRRLILWYHKKRPLTQRIHAAVGWREGRESHGLEYSDRGG